MDWIQSYWIYAPGEFVTALAIVMTGAFIRGVTGFGAGLVMVPLLTLLWGPVEALGTMIGISTFNGLQMLPSALRTANLKLAGPMMLAAVVVTPIGTWLHVTLDPQIVKKIIAGLVLLMTLISLRGWTYKGPAGTLPGSIAGGLMGIINGIAGVGGPAAVLYLISMPGKPAIHRANIVLVLSCTTATVLVSLFFAGVIGQRIVTHILVFFVPSTISIWLGAKAFHMIPSQLFKLIVLWFLVIISVAILLS